MIEILEFIFSSFWRWLGTLILISTVTNIPRYILGAIIARKGKHE